MAKTIEKRLNRRRPSISQELTGDCINLELLQLNNDSHDDEKRLEPMDDREVAEAAVEKLMEKTEGGLMVDRLILPNRSMLLIKGQDYNTKSVQAYNLKEGSRRSGLKRADASEGLNHTTKEEDLSKCSSSISSWRSLLMQLLNVMALFKSLGRAMGFFAPSKSTDSSAGKNNRTEQPGFHMATSKACKKRSDVGATPASTTITATTATSGTDNKKVLQELDANKIIIDSNEVQLLQKLYAVDEKLNNVLLPGMVEAISPDLIRYWLARYTLFSRFDDGIMLDGQGLFSVTPEAIARNQAARCAKSGHGTVIDAFTGAGGNAIQFACMNFHVIAIDIDPKKIEYARNNARVYGVEDRIDFIVGDFFQLAPTFKADVVFLSPPWGGPEYIRADRYDIKTMLQPADGFSLFKLALSVAPNVAYFLPKTVDPEQMAHLSRVCDPPLPFQIEKNYVQDELKAVTVYYGDIAL